MRHLRPIDDVYVMSAFAPIATKLLNYGNGRNGPEGDIPRRKIMRLPKPALELRSWDGRLELQVSYGTAGAVGLICKVVKWRSRVTGLSFI